MSFDSRWRLFADPAAIPSVPAGLDVHQQQAMLQAAFKAVPRFGHDYLFLAGYALINAVGCALVAAAWFQGWPGMIAAAGLSEPGLALAVMFLVGLLVATLQAMSLSRDLAAVYMRVPPAGSRAGEYLTLVRGRSGTSRTILAATLRSRQMMRTSFVRYFARTLLALGMIGTLGALVLGPAGITGIPADTQALSTILLGLTAAGAAPLHLALLGLVFHVWLAANHRLLKIGAMHLVNLIVERGEIELAE